MLSFFFSSAFLFLIRNLTNLVLFPLFLFVFFLYSFTAFDFSNMQSVSVFFGVLDEVSVFMVYMTVLVMFVSFLWGPLSSALYSISFVCFFMVFFCIAVFVSDSLFSLYLFYEASLVPILYIILNWGSYPERSLSAMILLIYTAVFSIPFVYALFFLYSSFFSFSFSSSSLFDYTMFDYGLLLSFIVFLTFAVNLPVYGLHFWLPIAHVEAPTFGSMILAGVLLNLGGLGLIRFSSFLLGSNMSAFLFSYGLVFMCFVTVVCCFQSDFKRLIAYSSVSHMIAVPLLLLVGGSVSFSTLVMLILFHGLSSPALFMLVGVCYSFFGSRQLVFVRGLFLLSPLVSALIFLAFLFTLSAPPFSSFVSEVFFFTACLTISTLSSPFLFLFALLSLVYNVNWLSSMTFSSAFSYNSSYLINYLCFFSIIFLIFISFPVLLLIPMF